MIHLKQKNTFVLIIFLIVGLLFGSLIGEVVSPWLPFLDKSQSIVWEPKADLNIISYDFYVAIKLNLASIAGLALAFWLYRKL